VVVDSSKSPGYGAVIDAATDVDLYVLHLVRDSLATAWSWQKHTGPRYRATQVAMVWDVWNPTIELLWGRRRGRYLRLRYEDFAVRPDQAFGRIARFVGESPSPLSFDSPHEVTLEPTHGVEGNPGRHAMVGRASIRRDDDWRLADGFESRRLVGALTWPLRRRYGYR
jgi:hypothetical protein